jgi:hypothetical protein
VRNRALALVQSWAQAFEARTDLSYVVDVYRLLVSEGE